VLGAVKSEFVKFGDVLERIKKKLDEASKVVDDAGVRKRAMDKKLRDVQVLPSDAVAELPASTTADDDAS
jgi:DNA recombination protein RmuC